MADRNLHLFYNKIYYEKIGQESFAQDLKENKNPVITAFRFNSGDYRPCEIPRSSSFLLKTTYPGMIPGTGYAHDSGISDAADEITCGFSFDYVTGLPFLPGSSVKGVLRSVFRKCPEAVIGMLGENGTEIDFDAVSALEKRIFGDLDKVDGDDVFLDAVIRCGDQNGHLMGFDYLAPHDNDLFSKTPVNVLHIVKILPDVLLEFRFVLKETVIGETRVAPEVKLELFRQLLLLMGAGAKTNVGYGALTETSEEEARQHLTAAATQHRTPRGEVPANRGYNARGNQNHGGRSRNGR